METKLNDNEVKMIAEMQRKIDSYEGFIKAIFLMARFQRQNMNYPLFDGTGLTEEMNFIWRFVKDNIRDN